MPVTDTTTTIISSSSSFVSYRYFKDKNTVLSGTITVMVIVIVIVIIRYYIQYLVLVITECIEHSRQHAFVLETSLQVIILKSS
jgi:hypothetical protein